MGSIKFSVHPLFYLFGLYYALTGRILIFIIYTVSAIVHELGHSFVAANAGYMLNKITLMPFGAVINGNIEGLKSKDEFKIALAGPLTNLAIGILFVAVWWIYPESYAFTDIAAEANFSLALINFLPVFPLDGGRVLFAAVAERSDKEKARKICRAIGLTVAFVLFGLFISSCFYNCNLSLLFFSLFVLFGAFDKNKENKYIKIYSLQNTERLKRGILYKKQAVDENISVKRLVSILSVDAINEIVVFSGGKEKTTLSQKKIEKIIGQADIYSPIKNYI